MSYKILILGASYGSLLATKLALAGHSAKMICLPNEAELFNKEGAIVRMPVKGRADAHGNVDPCFDFVYLDGAKNWTIDGLAVILIEKLLRPGRWLLMDDLDWTYGQDPGREITDGIHHRELSERERTEPHLRAVFDLIVAQHPSFTELRRQDERWGWARKAPGEPRRYSVETSRPLGALAANTARKFARRARRRLASSK